ncbi:extracellular solute-binding protein [Helicobacter apodemus]|uniref:ABC transporter substrate-binding protein n=1 Tax=Helicobacter apodemus TaxID=135569 RepID=A0A2U8FGE7_9HELI|nr:extracellular solute-binding protein [Helicobacter apodemus]AWI34867.1 ABC transporter substrate-binding protein [Helicobacter apodemus]
MRWKIFFIFLLSFKVLVLADTYSSNAFAINGEVKYKDLQYFDYVNPKAKKGGHIKEYAIGTYDSFYDFLLKGTPAKGLNKLYDTLMVRSLDEPSSQYGLIAQRIERAEDNSFVIFHLNKNAYFHDGVEVSAFDVEFSFYTIARGDNPVMNQYYADVKSLQVLDKYTIRFDFSNTQNREIALILGDLPVLPKHYYTEDIAKNPLKIPLGSGPYQIENFVAGRSITYKRVENYWAKNHPTRIGYFNFDKITYDYYKDDLVALEAFKAGRYDYRLESSAKNWANGYEGVALKNKNIIQEEISHSLPSGMQGFFFNLRKPIFQDILVREALNLAFDFEWSNKNIFFNQYMRTKSYFDNSAFGSAGIPINEELQILMEYKNQLPPKLFTHPFVLPTTDGMGENRENLKKAQSLLREAGLSYKNGKLYTKENKPFVFELLLVSPAMERVAIPFAKNLQKIGIDMKIRIVDISQYLNRLREFDFDMIVAVFPQSLSPGNEQSFFWGSKAANEKGSYNYAGIENVVVDALIQKIINVKNYQELLLYVRALDRVLLWNYYTIPHFHTKNFRVAYWEFLEHPSITPLYDVGFETWWVDEEKLQKLQREYPSFRR